MSEHRDLGILRWSDGLPWWYEHDMADPELCGSEADDQRSAKVGPFTVMEDARVPMGEVWVYGTPPAIAHEGRRKGELPEPDAKIVNIAAENDRGRR